MVHNWIICSSLLLLIYNYAYTLLCVYVNFTMFVCEQLHWW